MEKYFNKELVMTKENIKDFKNSTKCHNDYVDTHKYCNINVKLTHHKILLYLKTPNILIHTLVCKK